MTSCQNIVLLFMLLSINLDKTKNLSQSGKDKKFNVVIFLAKTCASESYEQDSGIKLLNFVEKTRVKHCAAKEDVPSFIVPSLCDCKRLLKSGISSLISFCKNVMGMTTVVASQENDTFSDGLRVKKSSDDDLEVGYQHPRSDKKAHFITGPEHSEVFKIRAKRQDPVDTKSEDMSNWDVFGVLANIKLTFFGKLLDKEKKTDVNMESGSSEVPNDLEQLGKVCENGLFDLVKQTLSSVQECGENGFLIIVLGGYLKEVAHAYSDLVQSVKHVVENTDEESTLILVTGSCPLTDNPSNTDDEQFLIPLYIKEPPHSGSITLPRRLYDIPYSVKNFLNEKHGGDFASSLKRSKRNVDTAERSKAQWHTVFILWMPFSIILHICS